MGIIWYQVGIQLKYRMFKIKINHKTRGHEVNNSTTITPKSSTRDRVLEWPNTFPDFFLGFSRDRFWTAETAGLGCIIFCRFLDILLILFSVYTFIRSGGKIQHNKTCILYRCCSYNSYQLLVLL